LTKPEPAICVFIPAFNAERTIVSVISRIPLKDWKKIHRVFVIDDGSSDQTRNRVAVLAESNEKIVLFSLTRNRGYGTAVKKGLELCWLEDPDFCVCLHADGQYPPEKIIPFVTFMAKNSVDILQGSRHKAGTALSGNMPIYKYVFGKLLVLLENAVFGLRMTDYHSGYLLYSRRALTTIPFEDFSSYFDFDLEVIASARACGLRIEELPISTHYGNEKSYLNPVTYGIRVLGVLIRYGRGLYDRQEQRQRPACGASDTLEQ
jgi:glycosyltransferase involved in cell wall biosynthesis